MGSGKTETALALANFLRYTFLDMDEKIEETEGISIRDIFLKYGEGYFREKERELLIKLAEKDKVIISTGGGTPCFFDNLVIMKKTGFVVYLSHHPEEILKRLMVSSEKDKRPLLIDKERKDVIDLLKARESFYTQAHYILNCHQKDVKEIAKEILDSYEKWKRD